MPPTRTENKSLRDPHHSTSLQKLLTTNKSLDSLLSELRNYDISKRLKVGQWCAGGGYADVYDGQLKLRKRDEGGREKESIKVAVKRFRPFVNADPDSAKRISRELKVLTRVKHTNIVPFRGFALVNDIPAFVFDWIENGTLSMYLANNPQPDVPFLAIEIAKGLEYLHSNGIVHSDLKSDNILMDSDGVPLLCDFGISRIVEDSFTVAGTSSLRGNTRWMSIELLDPRNLQDPARDHEFHTKQSDIWAYGMILYEILTGKVPYNKLTNDLQVVMAIISGRLPENPRWTDVESNRLWRICERCWEKDPVGRPSTKDILECFGDVHVQLVPVQETLFHNTAVTCIIFSPTDSRTLAICSSSPNIFIWTLSEDGTTTTSRHQLSGHSSDVNCTAWSGTGGCLVSGSDDKTIRRWNVTLKENVSVIETPHKVYAIACSPINDHHVVSGGDDGCLYVWDTSTGASVLGRLDAHSDSVWTVRYAPDGRRFISGSDDHSIIVWDVESGSKLLSSPDAHSGRISSIDFHLSGETFITSSSDKTITIWDSNTLKPIHKNSYVHEHSVSSTLYSRDGKWIVTTSEDGTISMWGGTGDKVFGKSVSHGCAVVKAGISMDSCWMAIGDIRGNVKVWGIQ